LVVAIYANRTLGVDIYANDREIFLGLL
jgi:hypothetical protein